MKKLLKNTGKPKSRLKKPLKRSRIKPKKLWSQPREKLKIKLEKLRTSMKMPNNTLDKRLMILKMWGQNNTMKQKNW